MRQTDIAVRDSNQQTMKDKLYTPTYLKELCGQYGLSPSKAYGQNYLISEGPIKKMIEAAEISSDDRIVEVGPGFGVLTLALAQTDAQVTSFEIEKKRERYWEQKKKEYPNLNIIWGNVLHQFDADDFRKRYKVVANLPYQITSQIIRLFLEQAQPPERMVVMVQKEVAERICAKPGNMSLLAVSVQYFGTPKIVTKVSSGSFWPAPKVDSAVLAVSGIHPKKDSDLFFKIVRAGFKNKRKQLWRNLADGLGLEKTDVQQILKDVTGNEKIRAQELSIIQWEKISQQLI